MVDRFYIWKEVSSVVLWVGLSLTVTRDDSSVTQFKGTEKGVALGPLHAAL